MDKHDSLSMEYGMGKKTLTSYMYGFGFSLLFTIISFTVVGKQLLSSFALHATVWSMAILQLLAQVVFFLRINNSSQSRWYLMPFIFTGVIILVLVAGSLWIMFNLNYNMMH